MAPHKAIFMQTSHNKRLLCSEHNGLHQYATGRRLPGSPLARLAQLSAAKHYHKALTSLNVPLVHTKEEVDSVYNQYDKSPSAKDTWAKIYSTSQAAQHRGRITRMNLPAFRTSESALQTNHKNMTASELRSKLCAVALNKAQPPPPQIAP